jgi:hypothetical protein
MNVDNFIVRPKRRLVEQYRLPEPWAVLDEAARDRLTTEIAGLPSEIPAAKEAFGGFLSGKTLSANQIEFIGMMIDHLTDGGGAVV